ncbi:MAG TPA: phytanoyl-CoA dioxygenase family protein [Caulobacteraceae bacterium]|nr:phytanoyl-CoA dioxygenase family protein [Caulobacteraceae bacterium]
MVPDFPADAPLGLLRSALVENGCVILRDFAPQRVLADLRETFIAAMQAALAANDLPEGPDDLDALYLDLRRRLPAHAATMPTLGRDLPGYFELIGWFAATPQVRALAGAERLQIAGDLCLLRVDAPHEDETGFDWHQDYPYNLLARSAVTLWAPLTEVTASMGLLKVIPGSHRQLLAVDICSGPAKRLTGQRQMRISGLAERVDDFEARAVSLPVMRPGDVLVFASGLLHCSGANRSDRSRWVFNARYGDLTDREVMTRHWWTTRIKYPHLVAQIHPELVTLVTDEARG